MVEPTIGRHLKFSWNTCGRLSYSTKAAAQTVLDEIRLARPSDSRLPRHCQHCNRWHLLAKPDSAE